MDRHRQFAARGPQDVVISGASGTIGTALTTSLQDGNHQVRRLVRRQADAAGGEVRWRPSSGDIDVGGLEGADAVVHLAGASVGEGRWTPARKALIRSSRVEGTRVLCGALARLGDKPRVLIAASAIGYYGDRGSEVLHEDSAAGSGFLAAVCRAWEAETAAARDAGIRVVNLRIGVVLDPAGGALHKLLTPFKLGFGGPIGRGRQWMSWVALADVVAAIEFLMFQDEVHGAVNAVAPNPVTNKAFARALGRVLRRPALLPTPGVVVKAVFGEMGRETVLASQRVEPRRLSGLGFRFEHPELAPTLRHLLARRGGAEGIKRLWRRG